MLKDTYKIDVNPTKKVVEIAVGQLSNQDMAVQFINEYKNKIDAIQASEYILEIDCKAMTVVSADLASDLENVFRMYASSGFKMVKFLTAESAVVRMQFNRLGRTAGLKNIEIIQGGN